MLKFFLLGVVLALCSTRAAAFSYAVELDAPAAYRALLRDNLELERWRDNPRMDAAQLERLVARTRGEVATLMQAEGFYSPAIEVSLERAGAEPTVRVRVDPGAPVRVASVKLEFSGAITSALPGEEPTPRALRERWPLKPGEVFRQGAWEDAKRATLRALLIERYPGARIVSSRATVDPATLRAELELALDSGPPYRFGKIEIRGLERYPARIVDNLNPLTPGEPYRQSALFELQTRLQNSGYFDSVSVEAPTAGAKPDAVPVVVTLAEAKRRRLGLGVGVSSDTGVRGQIEYQDNNIALSGLRLLAGLKLDKTQRSASVTLSPPVRADGARDTIGASLTNSDLQGERTRTIALDARRTRLEGAIERSFGLQYQVQTQQVEGVPTDHSQALVPYYNWIKRDVDSLLDPQRGYVLNLQLGAAAEGVLSDRGFVRGYGKWTGFVPLARRSTLILRAEGGAVLAGGRDGIPSSYLFRAGGDQSVRGYAYQSLGLQQASAVVGGRVLGVASAEAVHWITPTWGAALFYDVGDAADTLQSFSAKQGYGVGARWRSPVGPINLDLAYGREVHQYRIHFSLGFEF
jgi:translocation and assembly module TamA